MVERICGKGANFEHDVKTAKLYRSDANETHGVPRSTKKKQSALVTVAKGTVG